MSLWWSERCVLWPEINESLSRSSRSTLIDLGQSVYQLSHYIVWRTSKALKTLYCFAEKRISSPTYTIVPLHVFKCMCVPPHCRLTYPSFSLDVYCNDSTNPLAPTFDVLGTYVQKYMCVIMYMYVYLGNGLWDILCDVLTAIHNLDQAHTAWCFYFSKMCGALMSIAIKMSHNGVKICCLITTPSKSGGVSWQSYSIQHRL